MSITSIVVIREVLMWARRVKRRVDYYALARARADTLGRPLVVIGDPMSHVTRNAYGYGDVCIDINGCPAAPRSITADISTPGAIPYPDNSVVVFVACVLEYVIDIEAAWDEILRAAGGPENVFIVHVESNSLTAFCYPGAKWAISSAPPLADRPIYRSTQRAMAGGLRR